MRLILNDAIRDDLQNLKNKITEKEHKIEHYIRIRKHRTFTKSEQHDVTSLLTYCTTQQYRLITDIDHTLSDYEKKVITKGPLTEEDKNALKKFAPFMEKKEKDFFNLSPYKNARRTENIENITQSRKIIQEIYQSEFNSERNGRTSLDKILKHYHDKKIFYFEDSIDTILFMDLITIPLSCLIASEIHLKNTPSLTALFGSFYLLLPLLFSFVIQQSNNKQKAKQSQNLASTLQKVSTLYKCYGVQPKQPITFEKITTTKKPEPKIRTLSA